MSRGRGRSRSQRDQLGQPVAVEVRERRPRDRVIEAQRHLTRRRILLGHHGHAERDYALFNGKCAPGRLNLDCGAQSHAKSRPRPCMCSHRRPLPFPPRRGAAWLT